MKLNYNNILFGTVIGVCLLLQIVALSTQYVGRYDTPYNCGGDLVDCGPSRYVFATVIGDFDVDAGFLRARELKAFNRTRVAGLIIPVIIEVIAIGVFIDHKRKI